MNILARGAKGAPYVPLLKTNGKRAAPLAAGVSSISAAKEEMRASRPVKAKKMPFIYHEGESEDDE